MRRVAVLVFAGTVVACTSFGSTPTSDAGAADATDGPPTGPGPDGGDGDAAVTDASPDARGCIDLDVIPDPATGWRQQTVNGGTLVPTLHDGRKALAATIASSGQQALLVRNLPAGNPLSMTFDLEITGASSAVGWVVLVVQAACTTPSTSAWVELAPGPMVEAETPIGTAMFGAVPSTWQTLTMVVTGDSIALSFAGITAPLTLPSAFANAVGCTLAVGAQGTGNIPVTSVYLARVCFD
jgi:hypothetical protein